MEVQLLSSSYQGEQCVTLKINSRAVYSSDIYLNKIRPYGFISPVKLRLVYRSIITFGVKVDYKINGELVSYYGYDLMNFELIDKTETFCHPPDLISNDFSLDLICRRQENRKPCQERLGCKTFVS